MGPDDVGKRKPTPSSMTTLLNMEIMLSVAAVVEHQDDIVFCVFPELELKPDEGEAELRVDGLSPFHEPSNKGSGRLPCGQLLPSLLSRK